MSILLKRRGRRKVGYELQLQQCESNTRGEYSYDIVDGGEEVCKD